MPGRNRAGSAGGGSDRYSRVGDRQRACGKPECQAVRRKKTQASWRARNPSYAAAYRIDQRYPREPFSAAEPLRVPAPLNELPWDLAKDQFGGKGADFIGRMGTLLLRSTKDQFNAYRIDPTRVSGTLPGLPEKTRSGLGDTETRAANDAAIAGVSSAGPPPGTPPGAPPGTATAADRFAG